MKKNNISNFNGELVASNQILRVINDNYLTQLTINKIVVLPLQKLQGNVESKTNKDVIILITSGSGSMEVNGKSAPISAGEIISVKASESFVIINDALDAILEFVSILSTK
jgi:mannose-6-phosphate isomerase-like protein (cupin superfamily)